LLKRVLFNLLNRTERILDLESVDLERFLPRTLSFRTSVSERTLSVKEKLGV